MSHVLRAALFVVLVFWVGTASGSDAAFVKCLLDFEKASIDSNNITLELGASASIADQHGSKALRLKPRQNAHAKKTVLTFLDKQVQAASFSIEFKCELLSESSLLSRDMYLLSSSNLYVRYNCAWNIQAFQFGIQTEKGWVEAASKKDAFLPQPNHGYHIAVTCDGSEIRLYIDGALIDKAAIQGPQESDRFALGTCGWGDEPSSELDGWIDDLRFSSVPVISVDDSANKKVQDPNAVPLAGTQSEAAAGKKPHVVVPKVQRGPEPDGNPFGDVWKNAAWVGNPVYLNQNEITSKLDMQVGLLWDSNALYVGFRCSLTRPPIAVTSTPGDDGLERDDSVEVTLNIPVVGKTVKQPLQFKLNCTGLRDDAIGFNFAYNADWQGKVRQEGKNWYATFKIPFSNFNVLPKPGDCWDANFGAYLVGYDYRAFLWTPVSSGHHHQGPFGILEFGSENTSASSILSIKKDMAAISASGTCAGGGLVRMLILPSVVTEQKAKMLGGFVIANFDEEAKSAIAQKSVKVDQSGKWQIQIENIPAGKYLAEVVVMNSAGKLVNLDVKPINIERSLEITILRYPVAASASAQITVYNMGVPQIAPAALKMALFDEKGVLLRDCGTISNPKLGETKLVSLGQLRNGSHYEFRAEAVDSEGKYKIEEKASFTLQERPAWADTQAGKLDGKVLSPFSPITIKDNAVSLWGRTYHFDDSILPTEIISSGRKILSERIHISVGDQTHTESLSNANEPVIINRSDTGDKAEFQGKASGDMADVMVNGSIEFDGFMQIDLTVNPKKPLNTLSIDILLNSEFAKYLQPCPNVSKGDHVGTILEAPITMDAVNSLWICNADAGLFFCCDSIENWKNPENQAIQIVPQAKTTNLKLNFYNDKAGFTQARTYRFYLQAAPIRPYNKDWSENGSRVMNGLLWGNNVSALEDDTVRSIDIAPSVEMRQGTFEVLVQNESDLDAVTKMDFQHWAADQKLLTMESSSGTFTLLYSKQHAGIILSTPWGVISKAENACWKPGQIHKIAFIWGDIVSLYIDGVSQGELKTKSEPMSFSKLNLGSVSARFTMKSLRMNQGQSQNTFSDLSDMQKQPETFLFEPGPINLRSQCKTPLRIAKELGTKTLIFFENWCSAQNGGYSKGEPLLKQMVDDCHQLGLKVIFYFGFEIADVPEHQDMIQECKALIGQSPNFYSPAQMNTYWVSYGSPYQEYLLYNMQRLKREIGIDGVYLDGTLGFAASDNPAYGCGYTDADGNRKSTMPVLRIREFSKRMNNIFIQDGGTVFAHLAMVPPTMGFVTNTYLGEHVGFLSAPWESVTDLIPLNASQAIYGGYNTGVPAVLCIQNMWPHMRSLRPYWYKRASAWADLHRVDINTLLENEMADEGLDITSKRRKLAEFGADKCLWVPYWLSASEIKSSSENVKTSVYRREDGAMVCAVANLSGESVDCRIEFPSEGKLSMPATAKVLQLMDNLPVNAANRIVEVKLSPYEGTLLIIQK